MDINKIYNYLDNIYSFKNQEEWDASGVFARKEHINKILVCLDVNEDSIKYCIDKNIDLVISHHPLFIEQDTFENDLSIKNFRLLEENKISAIFLHTPFDSCVDGMNHKFLNMLKLKNVRHGTLTSNYVMGEFVNSITIDSLASLVKQTFKLDYIKYNEKYSNNEIKTVAFCSGSGSSFIYELNDKMDVFITSDIKYHTWIDSDDLGVILIDINHNIENMFIDIISEHLRNLANELEIFTIKSKLTFKTI